MTVTPVDPDTRSLVNLLQGTLDRLVTLYQNAGVALPERRYWTLSEPAVDCEQVTVTFIQAHMGPPGDEAATPQRCTAPRSAALQVQVVRCVPVAGVRGRPPTSEQIQSASEQLAVDAYLLLDVASDLDQWDPIGPGLGVIATVDAGAPSGGFQGVTLNVTMAIP